MNKKTVLIGGAAVSLLAVVLGKGNTAPEQTVDVNEPQQFDTGLNANNLGAEADSVNETLRTLISQNRNLARNQQQTSAKLTSLQEEMNTLKSNKAEDTDFDIEGRLTEFAKELQDKLAANTTASVILGPAGTGTSTSDDQLFGLNLRDKMPDALKVERHTPSGAPNLKAPEVTDTGVTDLHVTGNRNQLVTVEPIDMKVDIVDGVAVTSFPVLPTRDRRNTSRVEDFGKEPEDDSDTKKPIYTVPKNSTLMDTVAMSGIIGRVPKDGTLTNPYRFKILVGGENLASNNLYIPNLDNMVFSGYAEGDFNLECASGNIDSVTYTFQDGTVLTQDGQIGWFSDKYGNPCIPGLYISNFMEYLTTVGSVSALAGFASAIAEAQVTTTGTGDDRERSITGDALKYATGEGISESSREITQWLAERQDGAFDAVWLEAGEPLVVHIEEELHIDYDLEGRRLVHHENVEEFLR
ncbi:TIGR03752 family integrating conjugative element protein [Photobacterium lutimaris]|uniref:TIGR03752 family integrating conjugative element protein n=1 Tax=Photobacterium lutimaris TaxID=388278 RepID=A0A2T3ITV4_9GAMM|nr:TIGR03752 family integrating conjugative element protein [Photobacterium lutimaris]PSU31796.1 TIGR03752 family integrating conjugative element protein [Photobacterium lutimaris]TDR72551.1 integrating conjugative element protein (TIGR03752 family) [Photobacterium lutimaris]